jgi:hypothetical protein
MGIRFLCPTCSHKLNVKTFLAGKRGVCPQCGAGLDIPLESQITKDGSNAGPGGGAGSPSSDDDAPELTVPLSYPASPTSFPAAQRSWSPAPRPNPAPEPAVSPIAAQPAPRMPLGAASGYGTPAAPQVAPTVPMQPVLPVHPATPMQRTVPMQPATPAQPMAPLVTAQAPLDPIDEAPQAIWYVRPPSGGQYGPARGDVMRKWMSEGRVSPDSLVWREGWQDWRTAADAFPALGAAVTPPMPAPVTPAAYAASATPAYSATGMLRSKRRNSTALAVTIVTVLGLMCLALFVTLVIVLLK